MRRNFTCIICPNSCEIVVTKSAAGQFVMDGAACKRGIEYIQQELVDPQRNIATSVLVENGAFPLVSVRLTQPVPKPRIFDVINEIKRVKLKAPVTIGQVIIRNVLGLSSDVIATKNVSEILADTERKHIGS